MIISKPAVIAEADLVAAIAKADRYVQRDALSLPPLTSALAEIWALMIYENTTSIAVNRLTGTQLAAWEHAQQGELLPALPSEHNSDTTPHQKVPAASKDHE